MGPHEPTAALAGHYAQDLMTESPVLNPDAGINDVEKFLAENEKVEDVPIVRPDDNICIGFSTRDMLKSFLEVGRALQTGSECRRVSFDYSIHRRICDSLLSSNERTAPEMRVTDVMQPAPLTLNELLPAATAYKIFSQAKVTRACVTNAEGQFRGVITREGLYIATEKLEK